MRKRKSEKTTAAQLGVLRTGMFCVGKRRVSDKGALLNWSEHALCQHPRPHLARAKTDRPA
eukprot:3498842-Rhodomonas_salina.1